jgi:pSer/pThr/pTyr-binding forkhead associated (FHA) protein
MSLERPEQTKLTRSASVRCFKCGHYAPPEAKACPSCGHQFPPRTIEADELTAPVPATRPTTTKLATAQLEEKLTFPANASAILQFLPTGACVSLALEHPIVLGRGLSPVVDKMLDLTDFQGLLYGVSRQHCKLERRGTRLYVADLGSTNGTYYNDRRLPPFQDQVVGHGDQLILGAMHVVVMFSHRG